MTLTVFVNDRHYTAGLVQRGVRQTFFSAQSVKPFFYFEGLDAECSARTPSRDKVIVQNVPVDLDGCVGLRVDSIGLLAQLVLHVVVS